MNEVYKRLREFIINKGFIKSSGEPNISAFEENIDVSNDTIGKALRQSKVFKIDVISKIFEKYSDFDANWIFTGKETVYGERITKEIDALKKQIAILDGRIAKMDQESKLRNNLITAYEFQIQRLNEDLEKSSKAS